MRKFNVRVYGILLNENKEVLISEEFRNNIKMTKFPGGGLEFGEGTVDCLKREIMEEMGLIVINPVHFYTTDFFVQSAFNEKEQLISIYYKFEVDDYEKITVVTAPYAGLELKEEAQCFRWVGLRDSIDNQLTFPIDKAVFKKLSAGI